VYGSLHQLFHLNFFAYWSDMMAIAPVYGASRQNQHYSIIASNWNALIYLAIAVGAFLVFNQTLAKNKQSPAPLNAIWLSLRVSFLVIAGILLCAFSCQNTDIPIFAIVGLICLEQGYLKYRAANQVTQVGKACLGVLLITTLLLGGTILLQDMASIAFAANEHRHLAATAKSPRFHSKTLGNMVIPEVSVASVYAPHENTNLYPQEVEEGLALLRRHLTSNSRIISLTFSNPFPFALELPPAGGVANWCFGNTFNYQYFPTADQVFKSGDIVMIPRKSSNNLNLIEVLRNLYGDYLENHFVEKDSSPFWALYVRRSPL
ncbi:MAG: hypothetical protein WCA35_09340, partial [Kovacikia sp.]